MIWKNSVERYGAVAKTLHWVIAILILMMLVMGWRMGYIPNGPDKFWVYSLHKSLGITILGLMVVRLAWRLVNFGLPRPLPTHQKWEQVLAAIVHWSLYAAVIAQPLSGWILTSAANSTINWFGYFPVPAITGPDPALRSAAKLVHDNLPLVICGLLFLHIAGALKHVFIDKDGTLRRMLPFTTAAFLMFASAAHGADKIPHWTIDRAKSTLGIEATQEGSAFKANFKAFDGEIMLDPEHPETGKATITIDLNSFNSGNEERDSTVKGTDWFDLATVPTASYQISKFEKSGKKDGELLAMGILRLRGIEKPIALPFTLTTEKKDGVTTAHAVGETSLKRLDFGVGAGQWADPAMVGDAVLIHVDLTATQVKE